MKKTSIFIVTVLLSLGILTGQAQSGGPRGASGPSFGGALGKLFGDNQAFTANVEIQNSSPTTHRDISMPGKISFSSGQSRFEMNMGDMKGGTIPPAAVAQMKEMGLDMIINITRPDQNMSYLIYPNMQSYVAIPTTSEATNMDDYKIETTELGKETIDGHDCVKNQVTVTDKDGTKHESIVWDATDLNRFPVQIQSTDHGSTVVMLFKNVSLKAPDASVFEVPAGFTKYSSPQEMMQAMIGKKMGAMGHPPGQ